MGIFDWFTGKKSREESRKTTRPQITEPFGEDSPFVGYQTNNSFVLVDRDTFEYQFGESNLPNPSQRDLDTLLPTIHRVRARSGGIFQGGALESFVLLDTTDSAVIAEFRNCFTISEDPATFNHCACLGGPTLELYSGAERVATIGMQHGHAIRWNQWRHDAQLLYGQLLTDWLRNNGVDAKLLEVLFQNPFAFSGGRIKGATQLPLARAEQRLFLVEIMRDKGDLDGALAECDSVLASEPKLSNAYVKRGFLRSNKGDHQGSVSDFSTAIANGDGTADALWGRAVALDNLGKGLEAIEDCTAAILLDENHANAFNSRGLIHLRLNALDDALVDLGEAIRISPDWKMPYLNRAFVHVQLRDLDAAIADYTQVASGNETSSMFGDRQIIASAYWNRFQCFMLKGDEANADADRQEAIRRNPDAAVQPCEIMSAWIGSPHLPGADGASQHRDRVWYESLGDERAEVPCRAAGCRRGAIKWSVHCKIHHFEQIQSRQCPFSD